MDKELYLQKRSNLIKETENLIEKGEAEKANQKMEEIKQLDKDFETLATAAANINALKDDKSVSLDIQNMMKKDGNVVEKEDVEIQNSEKEDEHYREAFFNKMMNKPLNQVQTKAFEKMNATLTTSTTGIVIPQVTANKIWRKVGELYPFYNDTAKLNIKGIYNLILEDSSSDAKFYDESTGTETGSEPLKSYQLSGCELARNIEVSWLLKEMSMDDFENYIVEKMSKKMGAGLAYGSMKGKGKPTGSEFKPEPRGVITALEAESGTPQIITYSTDPTYKNLTALFALIKSTYKKTVYANNSFIWNVLANITDKNGKPYFVPDPNSGGVGRIFGAVVKEDDSVPEDQMLVGDATQYINNFNKTVTLDSEEMKTKRKTSYIGYAIVDGAPVTTKAFALLKKSA